MMCFINYSVAGCFCSLKIDSVNNGQISTGIVLRGVLNLNLNPNLNWGSAQYSTSEKCIFLIPAVCI